MIADRYKQSVCKRRTRLHGSVRYFISERKRQISDTSAVSWTCLRHISDESIISKTRLRQICCVLNVSQAELFELCRYCVI